MNGANKGEPAVHQEIVDRDPELKRIRTLSRKALENAVEEKHREIACVHKLLKETMQSAKELSKGSDFKIILRDLRGVSEELKMKIDELRNLYTQDKNKYLYPPLYQLDPFDDSDVIVRIGGRLRRARLEYGEKQPALLPKSHHLANLVVRHYHRQVHHQGRLITYGASRLLAHRRSQDSSQRIV